MSEKPEHLQGKKLVIEVLRKRGFEAYEEAEFPSLYDTPGKMRNDYVNYIIDLRKRLRERKGEVGLFGFGGSGPYKWKTEFGRRIKPDVVAWRKQEDILPYIVAEVMLSSDLLHKEIKNLQEVLAPLKIAVDVEDIIKEGWIFTTLGHIIWIVGAQNLDKKLDDMIKYTDEHLQKY
jgi:hypothetical protein